MDQFRNDRRVEKTTPTNSLVVSAGDLGNLNFCISLGNGYPGDQGPSCRAKRSAGQTKSKTNGWHTLKGQTVRAEVDASLGVRDLGRRVRHIPGSVRQRAMRVSSEKLYQVKVYQDPVERVTPAAGKIN